MNVPCTLFTLLSHQSTVPHGVGPPNQSKNDHLAMLGPAQLCGHRLHFYPFILPSTHYEVKLNFLNGCEGGKDSTYNFCLHCNEAKSLSPILAITRVLRIEEPFVYSHVMGQIDCLWLYTKKYRSVAQKFKFTNWLYKWLFMPCMMARTRLWMTRNTGL